ncbi:death-associated inhibitor of apoptosis 1-like [Herrania umbratica]|uniref:Death-associated inhibitor of apoptosis 1-like n=1 Tax=Herrania umbratica TaxID=108875 RepID=A0A6J0ZHV7_9ROSI|nr:death-associated inhibitor of apoptosis 1-like [Herrania umbratica]XP_021274479.1 death-associated inhibitor of apoptosis 1-like [Herrania umbratica]
MCSILNGMNQLKLHLDNSQSMTLSSENDVVEWCYALNFFARLMAYVAVLAVMVIVILLILKFMTDFSDDESAGQDVRTATESETNPLCSEKTMPLTYGTCEEDVETGSCSSGEDLYDGRICVICYDEQRNCFFVPCGHCATCYDCAQRISDGENKVCPVCRRVIGKVRKLFAP